MEAIVTKNSSICNGKLKVKTSPTRESEPFKAALSEKSLNYSQKERMAAAILQGNYKLVSPGSLTSAEIEQHIVKLRARDAAHLNRHAYQPSVLGVVSRSAKLLPPESHDMKKMQITRCAKLGTGDRVFTWNKSVVPAVPRHVPTEHKKIPSNQPTPSQGNATKRQAEK